MKIYIDLAKQVITKTESDTLYQGDVGSNEFNILFFNYADTTNGYPTMSQLAPNGRAAGDFAADDLGDGETHTYIEDGVTYQKYTFTMNDTWVKSKGRNQLYVWFNTVTPTTRKCVGQFNVTINESTNNYFIDDITVNPTIKKYLDDSFEEQYNYIDGKLEDFEHDYEEEVAAQRGLINNLIGGEPRYVNTASNILALTTDKGVAVATDTGKWYYYDENSTPKYVEGGDYLGTGDVVTNDGSQLKDGDGNNIYPVVDDIPDGVVDVKKIDDTLKDDLDLIDNLVFQKDSITGTINNASIHYKWETFDCNTESGETYYINYSGQTTTQFAFVCFVDNDGNMCSAVTDTRSGLPKAITATGNGTKIRFIIYPNGSSGGQLGDSATFTNVKLTKSVDYVLTQKVFEVGTGYHYSTLKKAIEDATQFWGSKVIVHGGTYDLINEFGGSTFFTNYTNTSALGLILKRDVHVVFEDNAKVTFMYDGSNSTVVSRFSPFNIEQTNGSGGFTLENVNIECTNCRYCVHDEKGGNTDSYKTRYINCNMSIEYLLDVTFKYAHLCIGCGLGHNADMLIDNCYFNTGILVHNNASQTDTTAQSRVVIKNNYLDHNTMYLEHCGASQVISTFLVSNNSVPNAIIVRQNSGLYVLDNIDVKQWNTNVRS